VLVLGESARFDRFNHSYHRPLTPQIDKLENKFLFKSYACNVWTNISIPCLMTNKNISNFDIHHHSTSFISIFKKLGFNTLWLANQGNHSIINSLVNRISAEADKRIFLDDDFYLTNKAKDEDILPYLDKYLAIYKGQKSLIVIHSYGSHFHYEDRYSENYRKYSPSCKKRLLNDFVDNCPQNEIINSYDNTILYTDSFINKVVERLKNQNSIMIYISDHGESLGENGKYMHGYHDSIQLREVPMIIWLSNQYKQNNEAIQKQLEQLQKNKDYNVTHDNLFHTILGCSFIRSPLIDKELNMCEID
jgi:glucan phosphoethanolaminetransferase (alkaline phosphatase superfamily)